MNIYSKYYSHIIIFNLNEYFIKFIISVNYHHFPVKHWHFFCIWMK